MKPDPVKEKIQSLCPDVMELKFGCMYKDAKGVFTIISAKTMKRSLGNQADQLEVSWFASVIATDGERIVEGLIEQDEVEILGSPITLSVVLRAINMKQSTAIGVTSGGQFYDERTGKMQYWRTWNLKHDNYDQQRDECKLFIGKLLGIV
jgi:hypothetical protein